MAAAFPLAHPSFAETKDSGWQPLFNGKNLEGWYVYIARGKKNEDTNHLVQVDGGAIHMYKNAEAGSQQPFGYIATEKDYANYHLRLEYKWAGKQFAPRAKAKRDAGVLYHVVGSDGVWPRSVECQIQEGDVGDIWTVRTRVTTAVDPATTNITVTVVTNQTTGIVHTNRNVQPRFLEAERGGVPFVQGTSDNTCRVFHNAMSERDGWNIVEVIVRGDTAKYIINGKVNNQLTNMRELMDKEWKPLTKGRILLQLEGAEVLYRNVEIKDLKD